VCASAAPSAGGSSSFRLDDEAADDGLDGRDMLSAAGPDLVRVNTLTMTEGMKREKQESVVKSLAVMHMVGDRIRH
jgi:hypothetical protein